MSESETAFGLEGKRVVVTGGLTGIGAAIALDAASSGASVIVASRNSEVGEAEAAKFAGQGLDIAYRHLDVASAKSCKDFFVGLASEGVDVLVNNSGVTSWDESLSDAAEAAWRKVRSVNLDGV